MMHDRSRLTSILHKPGQLFVRDHHHSVLGHPRKGQPCSRRDSNPQPRVYETPALTFELQERLVI